MKRNGFPREISLKKGFGNNKPSKKKFGLPSCLKRFFLSQRRRVPQAPVSFIQGYELPHGI